MNNQLTHDKSKSYNFVLNALTGSGANIYNLQYNIDWSVLPDQAYNVTMSFMSENLNLDGTSIGMVTANFGGTQYTFQNISTVAQSSTSFIGFIKPNVLSTVSYLYADLDTNVPIYLGSRPT